MSFGDSPVMRTSKSHALLAHLAHENINASSTSRTIPLALRTLAQTKDALVTMRLCLSVVPYAPRSHESLN